MNNLFFAFILSIISPVHTQALSLEQIQTVMDSSVLLRIKFKAPDKDGMLTSRLGGCSGTFVGEHEVLTAAHCVNMENVTNIWVRSHDHRSHRAFVMKLDSPHDLALLRTTGPKYVPIKLAKMGHLGEQVINVGNPYSLEFLLSEGIVASLKVRLENEFKSYYTITTAMINPGSSGGGAFNKDGELIGVNTMTMGGFMGWAGITMAVSLEDVKEFLHD